MQVERLKSCLDLILITVNGPVTVRSRQVRKSQTHTLNYHIRLALRTEKSIKIVPLGRIERFSN